MDTRPRRILSGCLIGLVIAALFVAFVIVPGVKMARETARRMHCRNNLTMLWLALCNYEDSHGSLPPRVDHAPDGKPLYSWRIGAMQYMHYSRDIFTLFDRNLPWNSEENRKSEIFEMIWLDCPNRKDEESQVSTYSFAVTAPNSVWQNHPYKLEDIPDGPENTLLIIELDIPGVHWMEPKDVSLEELLTMLEENGELPSPHGDVVMMCFADGTVYQVPQKDITPEFLKAIVSTDGGDALPLFLMPQFLERVNRRN